MKKRIALLVYPEFSLQEVSNLMYLFRWYFDTFTDVIATELTPIKSEEGIFVQPVKTCSQFCKDDYDCLILPGCTDIPTSLRNDQLQHFLQTFQKDDHFLIGAICAGPVFLAQAGVLKHHKYTDSLYVEVRKSLPFVEEENFMTQSVVIDKNIITAQGSAFNEFAIQVARKLGYSCPDYLLTGYMDPKSSDEYIHHLPQEEMAEFEKAFKEFF